MLSCRGADTARLPVESSSTLWAPSIERAIRFGSGARRDNEVILQCALFVAVIDEIDSRIDAFVFNLREARNIRAPLWSYRCR